MIHRYPPLGNEFWGDPVANFASLPASGAVGEIHLTNDTNNIYKWNGSSWVLVFNASSAGDVVGPSGATDNAVSRFDGVTGKLIQNSGVIINDTNDVSGVKSLSLSSLNNNRVIVSSGGSYVEKSAITANRALASDASGLPVANATTDTELGYVSGVTSALQTQLNGKQGSSTELTGVAGLSTTGLVTRTGAGAYTTRSIAASTGITVTNGSGVSANPTVAITDTAVTLGSYGDATHTGTFTVNQQGQLTAAGSSSIQIAESQVTNLVSDLAGKQATGNYITALTGDVTAAGPGSSAATLAASGVTLGTYGDATHSARVTFDSKGRATSASSVTITPDMAQATGVLPILNGGTGQTTATAAFTALAPAQGSSTGGFLTTNGTVASWTIDMPLFGQVAFKNAISANLNANVNDWNPTGISSASAIFATCNGSVNVTVSGFTGGSQTPGRVLWLFNVSNPVSQPYKITLLHDNSGSSASDRFYTPNQQNYDIYPNNGVLLFYDPNSTRWRFGATANNALDFIANYVTDSSEIAHTYTAATPSLSYSLINNSVVAARLKATATSRLFGRSTAGAGSGEEIAISSPLLLSGGFLGTTAELQALAAALTTTGILTRTTALTYTTRSVGAGSGVAVTNGDGVSGNPTVATADGSGVAVGTSTDTTGTISIGSGAQFIEIELIAAGGGGGAGRQGATTTARYGGGGGGGGGYTKTTYKLSELTGPPTAVYYSLGAYGGGAIGQVTASTNGANGTVANDSFVRVTNVSGATIAYAQGGAAGLGGTAAQQASVAGGIGLSSGGIGGASSTTLGSIITGGNTALGGGGGGAGASLSSGNATVTSNAGGIAYGLTGAASAAVTNTPYGGGGGAGANTTGNVTGSAGSNYGAGGGGGAASLNGTTSGPGGNGAPAIVRVRWW